MKFFYLKLKTSLPMIDEVLLEKSEGEREERNATSFTATPKEAQKMKKVQLRHDYALRQVVSKLTPARK